MWNLVEDSEPCIEHKFQTRSCETEVLQPGSGEIAALKGVEKLKDDGFIRDGLYPEWVSNPVLVKKAKGK